MAESIPALGRVVLNNINKNNNDNRVGILKEQVKKKVILVNSYVKKACWEMLQDTTVMDSKNILSDVMTNPALTE